jgi:sugar lactone lactonase YvrE
MNRRFHEPPRHLLLLTILAILVVPSVSMDRARFLELNKKGHQQAEQRDWKGLRETLIAIGREMPAPTPTYLLRMASVENRLGNKAEAIRWMGKYAAMGLKYDVAGDEDLRSLAADAGFAPVAEEMRRRTRAMTMAEAVCTLPLSDLMPEDLAFEKNAGAFVVSSIQHHTLYRVSLPKAGEAECSLQEITLDAQAKRWPLLAVSADPARNLLWMTACAMPGFTGFPKEDEGKAALFAIDGATGKTLRRFDLATGEAGVLGDMSIGPDGTVYVSDSLGGGVYRVRGDIQTATLEKIGGDFFSPQTPVLAADGKRLFVADYAMGVAVVDLDKVDLNKKDPPGQLTYLKHPESIAVTGIDGMYLSGDSLIGIQNGVEPERIMRFHLNRAQTEITSGEVVEQSTSRLGDPTHVVGESGWFYVTANVGWNKVDDHGQLKPGESFTMPVLLRFSEASPARAVRPGRAKAPTRRMHE